MTTNPAPGDNDGDGLPDFGIHDLASFNKVTGDDRRLAAIYFYQQLDCLVDLAYKVSCDFFKRPESHTNVDGLSGLLARLHARYGADETLPSDSQRDEMFLPIFGIGGRRTFPAGVSPKQEKGDFPALQNDLLKASQAVAERAVDSGIDMLRARFRDAVQRMADYLNGLEGDSVKWSRDALGKLTEDVSYKVFRSARIATVFGTQEAPAGFPYVELSSGHKLVENIWKQLAGDESPTLNRDRISSLQRAALRGAEAIARIIDFQENLGNADLDKLIEASYTWDAALWAVKASDTGATPAPAAGMGSTYSAPAQ